MKERPVDYFQDPDAVYLPLEKIGGCEQNGNTFLFHGEGRLCRVAEGAQFNQIVSGGSIFWSKRYGKTRQTIYVRLNLLNPNCFRVQISRDVPDSDRKTPMVVGDVGESFTLDVLESEGRYVIDTGAIRIEVAKDPYGLLVYDSQGRLVARIGGPENSLFAQLDAIPTGFIISGDGTRMAERLALTYDEKILGMGERFSGINRRGETVTNWTEDGLSNSSPRCYKPIPFLLSSQGYGVFFNTSRPFRGWIGSQSHTEASFVMEDSHLDYYFFHGPRLADVISRYTALTGRAALPPSWSFGYWIGRNSFETWPEALEVARKFRDERLPADVIHFDPPWMGIPDGAECNFEFDSEKFGDPKEITRKLREFGLHLSLWQLPYISEGSTAYADGRKAGAFVESFVPSDPPGAMGVIDFSNPQAVEWYQDKLQRLLELGADVIKVDFGETTPTNVDYHGFSGSDAHNLYPLLYNKAAFEVTEKVKGKGNALIWARAAYAGSQRYPVHWSGDPDSRWDTLPCVLKGGLSLALSGFTFWSSDIGGYLGTPSPELYIRWTQFAMFCSHVRGHGNTPREPWEFGEEALKNSRKYLDLRRTLMPYILREAEYAASKGLPFIRPLVLDYQDDPTVYHIEDEYLFGRDILVAPMLTEGARTRRVYLPGDEWTDYWTKETATGPGWVEYPCPLDVLPLYIRNKAVISMTDDQQEKAK